MTLSRQELGKMLREARESQGMTVRQAAGELGLDFGYLSRIESGRHGVGKYARPMAAIYGLDPDDVEAKAQETKTPLPDLAPYLRAKYDLSDDAVAELENHFAEITKQAAPKRSQR